MRNVYSNKFLSKVDDFKIVPIKMNEGRPETSHRNKKNDKSNNSSVNKIYNLQNKDKDLYNNRDLRDSSSKSRTDEKVRIITIKIRKTLTRN